MTARSLAELLVGIDYAADCALEGCRISDITADSRQVRPGTLFVAVTGVAVDGHDYLAQAVAAGAAAVVVNSHSRPVKVGVPQIRVADTALVLGPLAAAFFGKPAERMIVIGVTGTNGKTTCTYLLEQIVREAGGNPGVIGTVNFRFAGTCRPASHTTPDPVQLQRLLAEMAAAGVSHLIMEVSSHALEQGRVTGIAFDSALFTNLSREHLDFHGDMERYFASKLLLFRRHLKMAGQAVIVCEEDAGWGDRLAAVLRGDGRTRLVTCGRGRMIDSAKERLSLQGIAMEVGLDGRREVFTSPLVGAFNVRNILGVVGVARGLGIATEVIQRAVAVCTGAPGRMELVQLPGVQHATIIVDYAHTPDALQNVLETLKPLTRGRLLVVFGCGGDRDRGKRPLMGAIAVQYADVAIATSDNPRSEEPTAILAEIEAGMQQAGGKRVEVAFLKGQGKQYLVMESRQQAIAGAIRLAGRNDVVLISGKGHEDYQLTRSGKVHFDDRLEAKQELAKVLGQGEKA